MQRETERIFLVVSFLTCVTVFAVLGVGCAITQPVVGAKQVCPPLATYTADQQTQASATLKTIPAGDPVHIMIDDYETLRDEIRACNAAH